MPQTMTLSLVAALSIAGAGLGVQLGHSAVSEINPIYYGSPAPASRFFTDLTPNRTVAEAWQTPQSADYWSDFEASGRAACTKCQPNFVDELYPAMHEPHFASPAAQPPEEQRQLAPGQLDRYMSFPVTQEEARRVEVYDQSLARGDKPPVAPPPEATDGQPQGM